MRSHAFHQPKIHHASVRIFGVSWVKGGWILAKPKDGGIYFFSRVFHRFATVVTDTTVSATAPT